MKLALAVFVLACAFIWLIASGHAADPDYCTAWARGAVMMAIGQLDTASKAALTYPKIEDLRTRAYLHCGVLEEGLNEADSAWTAHLVNDMRGIVPATDAPGRPVDAPKAPAAAITKPAPAHKAVAAVGPAQVCSRVHRRVVYSGKSWRCVG